jgi:hypothetical protein
MVGLHKRCLKIALGKALLNLEQIRALIYQVSDNINSRPLMQQLAEENQVLILTPNTMIKPYTSQSIYDLDENKGMRLKTPVLKANVLLPEILTEIYNAIQTRLTKAIETWRTDYIAVLRERATFHHSKMKGESTDTPEIGEVVLVETPSLRGEWPLGLIVKINYFTNQTEEPSNIESVVVRIQGKEVVKPLTRIIPLEIKPLKESLSQTDDSYKEKICNVADQDDQEVFDLQYEEQLKTELQKSLQIENKENENINLIYDPKCPTNRPRRLAARKARQNIADIYKPKHNIQQHLTLGVKYTMMNIICLFMILVTPTKSSQPEKIPTTSYKPPTLPSSANNGSALIININTATGLISTLKEIFSSMFKVMGIILMTIIFIYCLTIVIPWIYRNLILRIIHLLRRERLSKRHGRYHLPAENIKPNETLLEEILPIDADLSTPIKLAPTAPDLSISDLDWNKSTPPIPVCVTTIRTEPTSILAKDNPPRTIDDELNSANYLEG